MDVVPAGQIQLAVDLGDLFRLPGHADVLHPVNGCIRVVDEAFGEHRIDAALRHAIEIVDEILSGVGGDLHALKTLFRHLWKEAAQLVAAAMHETEADMRELSVP